MKTIKEKQKIRADRYYKKNRDIVLKRTKKYYKDNLEKIREYKLKLYYGITLKEYENLLKKQDELCAICKEEERTIDGRTGLIKRLAVDHNHKSGKVRGLLCNRCNRVIGYLGESNDLIEKIEKYLKFYE